METPRLVFKINLEKLVLSMPFGRKESTVLLWSREEQAIVRVLTTRIKKQSVSWKYEIKEDIQDIRLESQRNWIPKNPVWIRRTIGNCYENSKAVIESVDKELKPELDRRMRPEMYGRAINRIIINCSYSYYDHDHCKTNYIIADEKLKLKQKISIGHCSLCLPGKK